MGGTVCDVGLRARGHGCPGSDNWGDTPWAQAGDPEGARQSRRLVVPWVTIAARLKGG